MRWPAEARAAIDEARKAGGAPGAELADALLLDGDDKEAARAAFQRAVDAGSTDAYAHYRLASLLWTRDADRDTLMRIQALLSKAASLNTRYAAAYDFLASVNDQLHLGEPTGLAMRAISLDPSDVHHRLTAARLFANARRYDDALKQVQAAADLADTEAESRKPPIRGAGSSGPKAAATESFAAATAAETTDQTRGAGNMDRRRDRRTGAIWVSPQ
jgi:tetratricopeptide (TPR) repeat protein